MGARGGGSKQHTMRAGIGFGSYLSRPPFSFNEQALIALQRDSSGRFELNLETTRFDNLSKFKHFWGLMPGGLGSSKMRAGPAVLSSAPLRSASQCPQPVRLRGAP